MKCPTKCAPYLFLEMRKHTWDTTFPQSILSKKLCSIFLQKSSDHGEGRLNVGTTAGEGRQRSRLHLFAHFRMKNTKKEKRNRNRGGVGGLYVLRRPLPLFPVRRKVRKRIEKSGNNRRMKIDDWHCLLWKGPSPPPCFSFQKEVQKKWRKQKKESEQRMGWDIPAGVSSPTLFPVLLILEQKENITIWKNEEIKQRGEGVEEGAVRENNLNRLLQ